ncbi:unnamed protein product, partial [Candidula unifasciata]
MEDSEQSVDDLSDSSPLKKKNNRGQFSNSKDTCGIDTVLGGTEPDPEIRAIDGDNMDDSKDFEVDEDIVDDGDEERDIDDIEEAEGDDSGSLQNKSQSGVDAFDSFEFVHKDASSSSSDNLK